MSPTEPVRPAPELVVALDLPTLAAAEEMASRLFPVTPWFKVGSVLFTAAGPAAVRMVQDAGGKVFLDLKFHDIPQTVGGAVGAAAALGVDLLSIHCAAGEAAMRAAAEASRGRGGRTRVLGITRLTSEAGRLTPAVVRSALAAQEAGLHGVVASARECAAIKAACRAGFVVLTPGIRPAGGAADDQRRTATPAQAVSAGADYLVVGRPIVGSPDPVAAAEALTAEIRAATSWVGRIKRERG